MAIPMFGWACPSWARTTSACGSTAGRWTAPSFRLMPPQPPQVGDEPGVPGASAGRRSAGRRTAVVAGSQAEEQEAVLLDHVGQVKVDQLGQGLGTEASTVPAEAPLSPADGPDRPWPLMPASPQPGRRPTQPASLGDSVRHSSSTS